MFNRKLKQRIAELERQVWELKNPPKYKIGQKIVQTVKKRILYGDYDYEVKGIVVAQRAVRNDVAYNWIYGVFDGENIGTYNL